MPEFIAEGPFVWLFLFLLGVVFCRAQATYWIGRYIHYLGAKSQPTTGWRLSLYNWAHKDSVQSAIHKIRTRGWVVIPLSFLTVGFQTLANAGSGIIRMPAPVYTAAMIPGCFAWATIYATIGFSMWNALIAAFAGSPIGIAIIVTIILIIAFYVYYRTKSRRAS